MRRIQGAWYLATGAWALLHRASFEALTGPKREYWLVQAVAGLTIAIGAVLVQPASEPMAERRARLLSVLSALAFAGVELRHGLPGRIRPIYLADAAAELLFAGAAARPRRDAPPFGGLGAVRRIALRAQVCGAAGTSSIGRRQAENRSVTRNPALS